MVSQNLPYISYAICGNRCTTQIKQQARMSLFSTVHVMFSNSDVAFPLLVCAKYKHGGSLTEVMDGITTSYPEGRATFFFI